MNTFEESKMDIYRKDYAEMPLNKFCRIYKIATITAIQIFGRKSDRIQVKRTPQKKKELNETVIQLSQEIGLPLYEVQNLIEDYTVSEIKKGKWIEGKYVVKDLIKMQLG